MDENERLMVKEMFKQSTILKEEVDSFKKDMSDVIEQNNLLRKFLTLNELWNEYENFVRRHYENKNSPRHKHNDLPRYIG